jgi:hypothetical protein
VYRAGTRFEHRGVPTDHAALAVAAVLRPPKLTSANTAAVRGRATTPAHEVYPPPWGLVVIFPFGQSMFNYQYPTVI